MKKNNAFLFVIPGLLGLVIFFIWPFIITVKYSFTSKPTNGTFVGLKNYLELFNSDVFLSSAINSIIILSLCVLFNMTIPLFFALLSNRQRYFKSLFILIILIPLVIPSGSMVIFWRSFFDNNGFLNGILFKFTNKNIDWLDSDMTRYVVLFIFLWKNIGYNTLLYISGLKGIKKEYYEIAKIEGANPLIEFLNITLIYLSPTFIITFIMSIVNSFKIFKEIYLITGQFPHQSIFTLQHFINNLFDSLSFPKLSASTVILIFSILFLTTLLLRLERKIDL